MHDLQVFAIELSRWITSANVGKSDVEPRYAYHWRLVDVLR